MKRFLFICILISLAAKGLGSEPRSTAVRLLFPIQSAELSASFASNAEALAELKQLMDRYAGSIDSVVVVSSASPDGPEALNVRLSAERGEAAARYLTTYYTPWAVAADRISVRSVGPDWQALKQLVEQSPDVPDKGQILTVLEYTTNSAVRQELLQGIGNGAAFDWLKRYGFEPLRAAAMCVVWYRTAETVALPAAPSVPAPLPDSTVVPLATVEVPVEQPVVPAVFKPVVALKTNVLQDAVLMPNLELEFYLAPHLTANLEGGGAWWARPYSLQYYRFATGSVELRWRFDHKKERFTGWYVGAYGSAAYYDLASGCGLGYQGECYLNVGLTAGYTLALGRSFAMEFGLAGGYVDTQYRTYRVGLPGECNPFVSNDQLAYWGLTKARVSLVWRIGSWEKGGVR